MVIAVAYLSGGSGKTTAALNLATMLSEKGKTLAVDFDPQVRQRRSPDPFRFGQLRLPRMRKVAKRRSDVLLLLCPVHSVRSQVEEADSPCKI